MLAMGTVALRALDPEDLDILYKWESEDDAWTSSNTVAPYSRSLLWEYLKAYDGDIFKTKELRMMITCVGEAAGAIDVFNLDMLNRRAEIGVYVASGFRGKGVAKNALQIVKRYAKTVLGLHQVYATVACVNAKAVDAFADVGFVANARLKAWLNVDGNLVDAWLMQSEL